MSTSTNHPTFIRCLAIAESAGSTAKTPRGLARFFQSNPNLRARLRPISGKMFASIWIEKEAKRKADPDATRARTDKTFRRRYLAGLIRRENAICRCDGSLDSVIKYYWITTTEKRRKELRECARLRSIVTGKQCAPMTEPSIGISVDVEEWTARCVKAPINMSGKNARVIPSKKPTHRVYCSGETLWKNGKPKKYTRATNDNYVRSLAVLVDPQTVDYVCHETRVRRTLPEGFFWQIDDNGLRAALVSSPADDFHPNAADLLRSDSVPHITGSLIANRETRLRYAAECAAELAQLEGVYVCVADSLRAGNCKVGTLSFAQRHHLDPARHYTAAEVLAQANGDAGRVRLAITAARIRHSKEMESGVCELSQHTFAG